MSHTPIGIDLGTSTSIICAYIDGKPVPIPDPGTKSPIVPSVLALSRSGELLVGEMAIERGFGPEIREAKRGIGKGTQFELAGKSYSAEQVSTTLLRYLKANAEIYLGEVVTDAVLTVPANYDDNQRRAAMAAAKNAGLNVTRLINEPTAAAIAFGVSNQDKEGVYLVYDFGGGTLDVTVLEMIAGVIDVKTSWGVPKLGGKDFDDRLIAMAQAACRAKYSGLQEAPGSDKRLKQAAERAKKDLSSIQRTSISVTNYGNHGGDLVDLDVPLSRPEFDALVKDLVDQSLTAVDGALTRAQMTSSDISSVLLVGGSTWVPAVRDAVLQRVGRPAVKGCDPDLAVAMGACIQAAIIGEQIKPENGMVVQNVITYGLGTYSLAEIGGRTILVYDEIMPPNTSIPFTEVREHYTLISNDQTGLDIELAQDHTLQGTSRLPEETNLLRVEHLADIPPSQTEIPHRVRVEFTCDKDQIITMTASIPATGQQITIRHDLRHDVEAKSAQALESVDQLWERAPLAQRHSTWVRRAEEHLATDPPNAEAVSAALVSLKTHISMNDAAQADDARGRLIELLADV